MTLIYQCITFMVVWSSENIQTRGRRSVQDFQPVSINTVFIARVLFENIKVETLIYVSDPKLILGPSIRVMQTHYITKQIT